MKADPRSVRGVRETHMQTHAQGGNPGSVDEDWSSRNSLMLPGAAWCCLVLLSAA